MQLAEPYKLFQTGDNAITVTWGAAASWEIHQSVQACFRQAQQSPPAYLLEAVPAFSSLAFYFDLSRMIQDGLATQALNKMEEEVRLLLSKPQDAPAQGRHHRLPVCYDTAMAPDLEAVAAMLTSTANEIIRLHTQAVYTVYMLGFQPGFPYLGILDKKLQVPRKALPAKVAAGSVGLAGIQTGIYPFAAPGGWQIIGRTPVQLFNPESEALTLLKPGDRVQFYSITKHEFHHYQGRHL